MLRGAVAGVLTGFFALSVAAEDMDASLRPQPNPTYLLGAPARLPDAAAVISEETAVPSAPAASETGLASSLRPKSRPKKLDQLVAAARKGTAKDEGLDLSALVSDEPPSPAKPKKKDKETASKKGSVCGVNAIKGEKIASIRSKVQGCGLKDGVRVTSVSGVRLSQAATIDCTTAKALNAWVRDVAQPAYGGAIVELKIAAHYICRSRNNKKGARISEHGRGKAVDIAGFVLDSGRVLTVAGNYNKTMRKAHKGACGIFGTTLGPGSDGYHEDHLHFDTADYRSGPYCR